MFGGKKVQELEAQVRELQEKLTRETEEKADLARKLESAGSRIAEMEAQLNDFDLERLKEEAKASRAEFEGLRELYARKNREFDDSKEEEEERFARDQALARHNLENEIRDNRQANRDYVANTVRDFGESYNYYLNQIRTLMDALGSVAARTGEALFSGEKVDMKASFGTQMRDMLKAGGEPLLGEAMGGEFVEEAEESFAEPLEDLGEAAAEAAEGAEESFAEPLESLGEAAAEAAEDAEESFAEPLESLGEAVTEAVEQTEESFAEPLSGLGEAVTEAVEDAEEEFIDDEEEN